MWDFDPALHVLLPCPELATFLPHPSLEPALICPAFPLCSLLFAFPLPCLSLSLPFPFLPLSCRFSFNSTPFLNPASPLPYPTSPLPFRWDLEGFALRNASREGTGVDVRLVMGIETIDRTGTDPTDDGDLGVPVFTPTFDFTQPAAQEYAQHASHTASPLPWKGSAPTRE